MTKTMVDVRDECGEVFLTFEDRYAVSRFLLKFARERGLHALSRYDVKIGNYVFRAEHLLICIVTGTPLVGWDDDVWASLPNTS